MTTNVGNAIFSSAFSGLHNYGTLSGTFTLASQNLSASQFFVYPTQTFTMNQPANPIANTFINISTFETTWRPLFNFTRWSISGSTTPVHSGATTYQMDFVPQYIVNGVSLVISAKNSTAGTITVPALTINYKTAFFLPPY